MIWLKTVRLLNVYLWLKACCKSESWLLCLERSILFPLPLLLWWWWSTQSPAEGKITPCQEQGRLTVSHNSMVDGHIPTGPSRCRELLNAAPWWTGNRPEARSTSCRSTWTGWRAPEQTHRAEQHQPSVSRNSFKNPSWITLHWFIRFVFICVFTFYFMEDCALYMWIRDNIQQATMGWVY